MRKGVQMLAELIRRARKISATELTALAEKHKSTISPRLQAMLASGALRDAGMGDSGSRGGKPRQYLELNPDYCHAIGLDASSDELKGGVFDLSGRQILSHRVRYSDPRQGDAFLSDLYEFAAELRKRATGVSGRCLGLGLGVSGLIDSQRGRIINSRAIGLRDYDLAGDLGRRLGLSVRVINDANAALLGEKWFVLDYEDGPAANLAYFFVDNFFTSVGFGLMIGGQLYEGSRFQAGELTSYALDHGVNSDLIGLISSCGPEVLAETLGQDAERRSPAARALRTVYDAFAAKLAYTSELLDPDQIIVGGNLDTAHAFLLPPFIKLAGERLRGSWAGPDAPVPRASGISYPPVCAGATVPLFQDAIAALG
jgi:predicted NBD/HSP70 family sugar kinase